MANVSQDRKNNEQQIRYLASQGMSQRSIARRLGVSRPLVQRVLGTASGQVPEPAYDQPEDFGEVQADFDGLVESARAADTIEGWRDLHEVARTCYSNGYRVSYNPLPLLMALSAAQSVQVSQQVWQRYHKEISAVYDWMREVKIGNYALNGDRGGVPEFKISEDWG